MRRSTSPVRSRSFPLQVDPAPSIPSPQALDRLRPQADDLIEPDIARLVTSSIDGFSTRLLRVHYRAWPPLPSSVFLRLLRLPLSDLPLFMEMKKRDLAAERATIWRRSRRTSASRRERSKASSAETLGRRRKKPQSDLLSMFPEAGWRGPVDRMTRSSASASVPPGRARHGDGHPRNALCLFGPPSGPASSDRGRDPLHHPYGSGGALAPGRRR